ncbi:MAG: GSCFA domain-containing protein [Acidimicrobiales bacterium]|nr:GSCFA domain-containing protein [Acidimicrobiales bacterium]
MSHPYRGLPDHHFWNRAVTWVPPAGVDPVVAAPYTIGTDDPVATMGSCFAQHLARHLQRSGLDYFVAEAPPDGMSPADAEVRQYGLFSARYGNVYTVAQAVQLFRRAYGDLVPAEGPWRRDDGALVDPFRPLVEPDGFADAGALAASREVHLAATRRVFEECSVFVFTLGLTEAWRSTADGTVLAAAPGAAGDPVDPTGYEFVNFGVDEVRAGLVELVDLVRSVNPDVRVLLTVSPVPLIATYEPRHVLVSTVASKSVLRVAADEAARLDGVDYFPSYEIIASATADRDYFEPDRREVSPKGVAHVMRCFGRHFIHGGDDPDAITAPPPPSPSQSQSRDVVCDEEVILGAVQASAAPPPRTGA